MPSCLGLFVQNNIIKYAKVNKEKDIKKVEAYGVKIFDGDVTSAIQQIVEETYSFNTPISINLAGESYNYFNMTSLLGKNDLQKAIKTEFDAYCQERGVNANEYEKRSTVVPDATDSRKLRVIYISENKIELNKRIQMLSNYKVSCIAPISMAIANLKQMEERENALIVNIEDTTTITEIYDQKIYNIKQLDEGSNEILEKINLKENSYSKSYEVCKNTTIYTSEGSELQEYDARYLEIIMPTLYKIVGNIKKTINEQTEKIDKVYITGTASLINNIDLYFQEYLEDTKCEILKPDFVTNIREINIKDYIEVNSAISMALMGLGEGIEGINFRNKSLKDKMPSWLSIDKKTKEKADKKSKSKFNFDFSLNLHEKLDFIEKNLLRGTYGLIIFLIVYGVFAGMLNNQLEDKQAQANERKSQIQEQIAKVNADNSKIQAAKSGYTSAIQELQKLNNIASENLKTKNIIPNLLNQIMSVVPENVQITSIQNTSDKRIQIQAQSNKYEQLGYLKAKLKTEQILLNVISSAGQKNGDAVVVTIEGDLP